MTRTSADTEHSEAVRAFADDLAKLDAATAHAVTAQAREMVHRAWVQQELQRGRESGLALDSDTVLDEILAEADADINATRG